MLLEAINVATKSVQNVMGSSLALLLLHFDAGRRGVCWTKGLFPLDCCDHKVCCNIGPCFLLAEGTVTLHWKAASALNILINQLIMLGTLGTNVLMKKRDKCYCKTSRENLERKRLLTHDQACTLKNLPSRTIRAGDSSSS
jgi:hypothetical protein